jgi:hypothetical protein
VDGCGIAIVLMGIVHEELFSGDNMNRVPEKSTVADLMVLAVLCGAVEVVAGGGGRGLGTVVVLVNYRGKRREKGGEKREKRGKERGGRVVLVLAFPLQIECTSNFAATLLMLHQPY